ncbi:NAD(P)-binding protein [Apiospora aurea]|uniref:NAD(P)-binding protein n=1 Tax=Apiospora aurea TaxID=335848 RepID=A0ABR1QI99_9PEZI
MGTQLGHVYRQLTFKPKPLPPDIRLDGQTAIVTGASAGGLGFEATKELAAHGLAQLILAVRHIAAWIKNLEVTRAKTGHESNVQVNHLGTAHLSLLLPPILRATAAHTSRPARLTVVASEAHFWTLFSERHAPSILQRLDEESSFKPGDMERYNTSKLLNILWTRGLSSRVAAEKNGSSGTAAVTINAVNPGFCASTLEQGGHCLTDAACRHGDQQGAYISEQEVKAVSGFVTSVEGERAQKRLWDETIALFQELDPFLDLGNLLEA